MSMGRTTWWARRALIGLLIGAAVLVGAARLLGIAPLSADDDRFV